MMEKVNEFRKVLLFVTAIIGLIAVILAIVGVATNNWISVRGNINELKKEFAPLVDPTGQFVLGVSRVVTALSAQSVSVGQIVIFVTNATLNQVEGALGKNLQSTTYSLFDKKIPTEKKVVSELKTSQGLVIAGFIFLFIGTSLSTIIFCIHRDLKRIGFVAIASLFFLIIGSILILLGYLLFTKIITEDFGHGLGIAVSLGYSFVLVVISSIIGILTAVTFTSSLIFHVLRATDATKGIETTRKIGSTVGLKDRRKSPRAASVMTNNEF